MGDLRRRVAEKKAKGLYGVDALMAASTEDDGEPFGLEELERLRNLAVQRVQIDTAASTKPLVGGAVSRIKRMLVRGASQPMYGMSAQATAFNGALLSYLSALAREVSVLERQVRAEREQGDDLRGEIAALRAEVTRATEAMAEVRAAIAHVADAALPERMARLERLGPADPGTAAPASPSGSLRLRLEATEDDAGRERRMSAYAEAFGGRAVLHLGAGSGRALSTLGEGAEGVEGDGELAAAAQAAGRRVRHADPVAHLTLLAPGSVDAILVTELVERLGGGALTALAGGIARALAPGGVAIVEGHHPNGVSEDLLFWRDPDRLRALHPDAVRMALEAAGLATTGVTLHPAAGRESGSSDEPQRYAVHAAR